MLTGYLFLFSPIAVAPQIMFMANPEPVPIGVSPQLTCTITAEPLANSSEIVRIMPNGQEQVLLRDDNPMDHREFMLIVTIRRVRFPQDDRALFQCRVTNANGVQVQSLTITVQGELHME